jgi:sugar phosphate isomerase/epimerase
MKVGIDSYSYHRHFGEVYGPLPDPGRRMTYPEFLRRAVELGVDGVSLETCFFESFDPDYLAEMRSIIDGGNLDVVVAWGHPKGFEGGAKPEAMADLVAMFPVCHALGARTMRVVGSSLDYRNDPHEPQLRKLTAIFKEAAARGEAEGVKLAMENHFDFTTDEIVDLVDRVGSPYFGITFDTGNSLRIGDDPVESVRQLGRRILATHTKDVMPVYGVSPKEWYFFACVPVGAGCINMPALVDELEKVGYPGMLAIELDYLHPDYEDDDQAVAQSVRYLQDLRSSRNGG